jgi:hypothetical protein
MDGDLGGLYPQGVKDMLFIMIIHNPSAVSLKYGFYGWQLPPPGRGSVPIILCMIITGLLASSHRGPVAKPDPVPYSLQKLLESGSPRHVLGLDGFAAARRNRSEPLTGERRLDDFAGCHIPPRVRHSLKAHHINLQKGQGRPWGWVQAWQMWIVSGCPPMLRHPKIL